MTGRGIGKGRGRWGKYEERATKGKTRLEKEGRGSEVTGDPPQTSPDKTRKHECYRSTPTLCEVVLLT